MNNVRPDGPLTALITLLFVRGRIWLGVVLATWSMTAAHAAAPMVKTQAPGYYRMMLGAFEVTALNDGVVALPVILLNVSPDEVHDCIEEMYLTDPFEMSFNAFLINTGNKLVLIDTGMGEVKTAGWYGAGHLLANLRAAGYQPEQIDEVYITHTHPDHVGGLILGDQRAFPNAIVRAAGREMEPFLNPPATPADLLKAPYKDRAKANFKLIRDLFEPYVKAGKYQNFDGDVQLVPGIRAMATHGHTPGHTSYVVESEGQTLVVLGDLVHIGAVQFGNPSAQASSDIDPLAATAERKRVFQVVANHGFWVAGAHLAFPGLGHIGAEQHRYLWVPANYVIPH